MLVLSVGIIYILESSPQDYERTLLSFVALRYVDLDGRIPVDCVQCECECECVIRLLFVCFFLSFFLLLFVVEILVNISEIASCRRRVVSSHRCSNRNN